MREPNMGESVYFIRRALYELRYKEGKAGGATEPEILNYLLARRWPTPVRNFEPAMTRLRKLGRAEKLGIGVGLPEDHYRLTPDGELEDEEQRRPWRSRVWAELTHPATVAKVIIGTVGFLAGVALTLLSQKT